MTSIDALQRTGVRACVLNSTSHISFVKNNYPLVQAATVESASATSVLLDAVRTNKCKAAVAPNVHLR